MTYRVYEVQEVRECIHWYYDIEAETEDEALELVQNGGGEPTERWRSDPDYGSSGYAVTPEDCTQAEEEAAWNAAADNWAQNGGGV
jgi:hypothetical protein